MSWYNPSSWFGRPLDRTLEDGRLQFSRSGISSPFGKLTAEAKTRISEDEKDDLIAEARRCGMSESEWVRAVIRVRLYGVDHVSRMHAAQIEMAAGIGPERGRS